MEPTGAAKLETRSHSPAPITDRHTAIRPPRFAARLRVSAAPEEDVPRGHEGEVLKRAASCGVCGRSKQAQRSTPTSLRERCSSNPVV